MKTYTQRMINISDLKPYERNARTHSSEQISQIMASIKEFGFTNPLLIDSDFNLIAGHGRLEAIKGLNRVDFKDKPILQVPCVICEGLSEVQKRALILADNKIALNAGWVEELLASELSELDELGFDLDLTGFGEGEMSEILQIKSFSQNIDFNALKLRENLCNNSDSFQITFLLDKKFKDLAQKEKKQLEKSLINELERLSNVGL